MKWPDIQCLTIDGFILSHEAQVLALCGVGAEWIQLRMKEASDSEVEETVRRCLPVCHAAGARLIVNDRIEIAIKTGADGVHLGSLDMGWAQARELVGDDFIIGGTINSADDAERAAEFGALDYVGVGPFRFTQTKKNLAPTLTSDQWQDILQILGKLPSYAIGGIRIEDLPAVRQKGVTGFAVSSGLFGEAGVQALYREYQKGWAEAQLATQKESL
ncbi:MAG: thiamine phosphate synthase [Puniceicoccales bacterium]